MICTTATLKENANSASDDSERVGSWGTDFWLKSKELEPIYYLSLMVVAPARFK